VRATARHNALVLTAHPSLAGLNSGKGTSGSTQWNNAFRSRMYFRGEEKESKDDEIDANYRELEVMKANYAVKGEIVRLRWNNGVFVADKSAEVNVIDPNATKRAEDEEFLMKLDEFEQQGRYISYKPKSNNYAPLMFTQAIPNTKARKHKREAYEGAMERLFSQRRISSVPYGKPSDGTARIVRYDPNQGAEIIDFPGRGKPDQDPDKGA
jgi:RecA-family ATPase